MSIGPLQFSVRAAQNAAGQLNTAEKLFSEVYELLELYGPPWYSEALRERIRSALGLNGPAN